MLIRVSGYNNGVREYLEEGIKNGRDYTRDELDERVILYGDLELTEMIYQQIPDKGQDRYSTITLSFREDEIPNETLNAITQEFKQFFMYAYKDEEYNFYAEAHLPKLKEVQDKKTGESVERKPHIHIVIPKKNLLSGNAFDPVGSNFGQSLKYIEAFQEYINQKYSLASPRDHVRVDPTSVADVLSRYKGDDFRGKNQNFKKQLVSDVIEKNISTRESFYEYVGSFGETRIRNQGKENEYLAVKLPGDAKFTNLKETIFQDDFIVRREVKKPPLDKKVIHDRMVDWPQRSKEIKYVSKATPAFRLKYKDASPDEKITLLAQRQVDFYEKHRGQYELHPAERQRDNERSSVETESRRTTSITDGLQSLPRRDVATDREREQARNTVLLPGNAYVHLGQSESGGGAGLRHAIRTGGRGRNAGQHDFDKFAAIPGISTVAERAEQRGYRVRPGIDGDTGTVNLPPYALNPHRIASIEEIQSRATLLFGDNSQPEKSTSIMPVKRLIPKPDRSASFVAAYFLRKQEQDQIQPSQKKELRVIDNQFFAARRSIMSDDRLTRSDKTQYVSVLMFERLKAHNVVKYPNEILELEIPKMGSIDIRNLIKEKRTPDNSISGPEDREPLSASKRFARLINNVNEHISEKRTRDRQRSVTANDLYTKRAKLSQNVHYLDKKTDRTMFVDTGKSIAIRKGGMTESAVAVALELAKEKFGSTLTINGSDDFKKQVIEVAAKNNMDIHFTDKTMNSQLEERKAELAIERDGQRIEKPDTAKATRDEEIPEAGRGNTSGRVETTKQEAPASQPGKLRMHDGILLEHGVAPYKFKSDLNKPENEQNDSYFVKLQTDTGKVRTLWGVGLADAVAGMQQGERVKFEDKGVEPVTWREELQDGSSVEKSGMRRVWEGSSLERELDKETQQPHRESPERESDGPDFD